MPIATRDLTRDWQAGDAERLARFFNKTGRGWPGGAWDPKTPEEVERQVRENHLLGAFVSVLRGEFGSYCSLHARPNETNSAYVGLLTADPDLHGKGYGKAVLLRAGERVYERGIPRVDLHTWPGNMKAVPLYKKSGYMWSPESGQWGVYMQNFTPGARRHPLAQDYFRKHDWYATLKRDLSLVPDERKRGKVRVYEYLWEEGDDRLRMAYDRQSWGLLEIETNDFLIGCSLDDEKLVAGIPQRVSWRIANHGKEPLSIVLMASGDEGVSIDRKEVLQVSRRADLSAEFVIDPLIKDKEKQPRVPILWTDLLVNGQPLRLEAGFQVQQPVHFGLDADGMGLRPNRPERVLLQCRNGLDRPVQVKLQLAASPGLSLDRGTASLRLPAKGAVQLPLTLTGSQAGAAMLRVTAEAKAGKLSVKPKPAELYAHLCRPGEIAGHVEKDRVVLESSTLRLSIYRRGGWMGVVDKIRNRWDVAGLGSPQAGPPFAWDEFFEQPCEARIEQQPGRAVAVLTTPSVCRPGVVLEHRVTLSNLPLIELRSALLNGTDRRLELRLQSGGGLRGHGGKITAPTPNGLVRGLQSSAARSLAEHHLSEAGEDWPEGWFAVEDREGVTTALIWDRAHRVHCGGGWVGLDLQLPAIAPGQSAAADPIYLFVGEGDYLTVRRWWQTLFGPREDRAQRHPVTREPLEFGLRPSPLVMHGRNVEAKLGLDSFGRLELDGRIALTPPQGFGARPRTREFKRANEAKWRGETVELARPASIPEGAYLAESTLTLDRAVYSRRQPVIVLGDPRKQVAVEQVGDADHLFRVANGVWALTIAPGFRGAAVSLKRGDEELLRSSYPEARPLAWQNLWAGGIQPTIGGLSAHDLFKQRFQARPIERRGRQGISWKGVRVSLSPKEGPRREDRLALDYLLAPGSAVFALALRLTRRGGTCAWIDAGVELYPVLGGSHLDAVLYGSADPSVRRLRGEFEGETGSGRWAVAENPKTSDAVLAACAGGEASVNGHIYGRDGYLLGAGAGAVCEAGQTKEWVFFVAYTQADRARELAAALSELKELP